jgi:hypothetical protein
MSENIQKSRLQNIIDQLKGCTYECKGGRLENNVAFIKLEGMADHIDMIPVKSSTIAEIGYDKHRCILRVRFQNNTVYNVMDVSRETVADMIASPSIGSFYQKIIRPRYKAIKAEI